MAAMQGKYGILDTHDNLWCGNEEGPLRYESRDLATAAATVLNVQMNWTNRAQVREIPSDVNKKRDELPTEMDVLTAIKVAEGEIPPPRRPRLRRVK